MSLDIIRERMRDFLKSAGLDAVCAWPEQEKKRSGGAVVAVSLREIQGGPGGFQDYLGEIYDREGERWLELYGKRARVKLGLDLYAGTASEVQRAADRLSEVLHRDAPEGLRVQELSCGEIRYEKTSGLFRCAAEALCGVYLYATAAENGAFLEFDVRGKGSV